MKLHVENLQAVLGDTHFRYDVVVDGGITGIFGMSGSGKSTLMKLLCGIEKSTGGRITFNNTVFFDSETGVNVPPHHRHVGVVFQEHYIFPHLTVEKNLCFGLKFAGRRHLSLEDVVSLLELQPFLGKMPACLSGGERQRVAIGRALLQQPELLLFDEPFSNLDRSRRGQIISYLLRIQHRFQIPLLIISHDLEDILKLTQSLIIVENQSILASGSYLEMMEAGVVPHLITPKRFINTVELIYQRYDSKTRLNHFGVGESDAPLIVTSSSRLQGQEGIGHRVRLAIAPDDIALSTDTCSTISIQNQITGTVTQILHMNDSFFVSVDCGVTLISEITPGALYQLDVKPGRELVCLFKAHSVEVVHTYQ